MECKRKGIFFFFFFATVGTCEIAYSYNTKVIQGISCDQGTFYKLNAYKFARSTVL